MPAETTKKGDGLRTAAVSQQCAPRRSGVLVQAHTACRIVKLQASRAKKWAGCLLVSIIDQRPSSVSHQNHVYVAAAASMSQHSSKCAECGRLAHHRILLAAAGQQGAAAPDRFRSLFDRRGGPSGRRSGTPTAAPGAIRGIRGSEKAGRFQAAVGGQRSCFWGYRSGCAVGVRRPVRFHERSNS